MKFTQTLTYPKSMADVLAAFTSQDYFTQKYEKMGCSNISVISCKTAGDDFSIATKMDQPVTIDIPSFAKKFVGDTQTVVQTDKWNKATGQGSIHVELKGNPAKVSSQMSLAETNGQTTLTIDWTIQISVPLIGGKLEKLIAEDIKNKGAEDQRISLELMG